MTDDPITLVVVIGTRPEIIKMAPVIRAAKEDTAFSTYIVHTGQHFDDDLSKIFLKGLNLPPVDSHLGIGSGSQAEQTAAALRGIEAIIEELAPAIVLAQGDTNAVLSAAIATSKMPSRFGHIEAGLRSFDRSMPEEINRVIADQVSDLAFAPTETAVTNLANEGIKDGVWMVGNTVVDACMEHAPMAEKNSSILGRFELSDEEYAVATIHRPRNTDNLNRLSSIVSALDNQSFPVIMPAHPRTVEALNQIEFVPDQSLRIVKPLNYLDFLKLLANARVVVTDSGGIQEESSILEIPCLTVRPNTERPETVNAGVNELIEPDDLQQRLFEVYEDSEIRMQMTGSPGLYGDGKTGNRILSIIKNELKSRF